MQLEDLEARIATLERERRRVGRIAGAVAMVCVTLGLWVALTAAAPAGARGEPSMADSVLRVRGLVVVDANGVERVVIGAPVPDPLMYGRRAARLVSGSGILLMDPSGNERSGYLTSDHLGEVFLTLDAAATQQALFLANASGGANLSMWDHAGNSVQLSAVGNPGLTMRRAGTTVLSLPDSAGRAR